MPRRKSAKIGEEQLIARVREIDTSYFLSLELPLQDKSAHEEAIISLITDIGWISKRHKKHLGRLMEIDLIASESFDAGAGKGNFFGSVSLKKGQCGAYVYLPARTFYALPVLIDLKSSLVDLHFSPTEWGYGNLHWVSISNESQLFSLPGFPGPELIAADDSMAPANTQLAD